MLKDFDSCFCVCVFVSWYSISFSIFVHLTEASSFAFHISSDCEDWRFPRHTVEAHFAAESICRFYAFDKRKLITFAALAFYILSIVCFECLFKLNHSFYTFYMTPSNGSNYCKIIDFRLLYTFIFLFFFFFFFENAYEISE